MNSFMSDFSDYVSTPAVEEDVCARAHKQRSEHDLRGQVLLPPRASSGMETLAFTY